ncbi:MULTISPECIES: SDR family oxidoreductase [unclassified Massilia]|uniref:SDR family oxidoreductase n=1 Tax=unclassified Massilia TaxID=2609279 RepID=UPI00178245CC|nr:MULTISPECIES: SDR family oxidoreductase [unclassified Massilia]MBD8532833.1 SDR family oxidoreductase [Massilia sp. CFBP 13647]MBD8676194.1 SDR family oxidoreductase [Massilia sp. CFBP 13721]
MKAIVTGHTKGLGAAIAAELIERGIPVLGLARSHSAHPVSALLTEIEVDLSDNAALAAFLSGDALANWLRDEGATLLVNNAGVVTPVGPLAQQDPLAALRAVTLNVAAPLALAAAVVRASRGERRILHISSGAGRNAYPGWSVYCATKAALDRHAEAVLQDGDATVRCCSLAPGVIDTGMQAEIRATPEADFPMKERFVQMKQEGALAAPEECARKLVTLLLSEDFGRQAVADLRDV